MTIMRGVFQFRKRCTFPGICSANFITMLWVFILGKGRDVVYEVSQRIADKQSNIAHNMLLGLDFDGIINNIEKFQLEKVYQDKDWLLSRGYNIVNPKGFSIGEILALDENKAEDQAIFHDFWKKHLFELVKDVPLRKGIKELINQVRADGDPVLIVTQRYATDRNNLWGKLQRKLFFDYLKKHGLGFKKDEVIFVPDDAKADLLAGKEPKKVQVIREKQIEVYLDETV